MEMGQEWDLDTLPSLFCFNKTQKKTFLPGPALNLKKNEHVSKSETGNYHRFRKVIQGLLLALIFKPNALDV